jgi:hypothetical protein
MIRKVISGGQTGVDIAALRAAHAVGLETGGWAPRFYLTELGPNPELAEFGVREMASASYPPRTAANIREADATLIIAGSWDRGSKLTAELCRTQDKPSFHLERAVLGTGESLDRVVAWLVKTPHEVLNVAGNRESTSPGIEAEAETFLRRLFAQLAR